MIHEAPAVLLYCLALLPQEVLDIQNNLYQVGGDVIPEHDPHPDYEDRVGQAMMRYHITCLSEGMKSYVAKPVNYD